MALNKKETYPENLLKINACQSKQIQVLEVGVDRQMMIEAMKGASNSTVIKAFIYQFFQSRPVDMKFRLGVEIGIRNKSRCVLFGKTRFKVHIFDDKTS